MRSEEEIRERLKLVQKKWYSKTIELDDFDDGMFQGWNDALK